MIIKNCIIITDKNSLIKLTGNDTLIGNKTYSFGIIDWKRGNARSRGVHFLVRMLYNIADFIHGIESGFKMCCIVAFLRNKAISIPEIHQGLCYKCYKKLLKSRS